MDACQSHKADLSLKPLCNALAISRASLYRRRSERPVTVPAKRPIPARALSPEENRQVLDLLHDQRFMDKAPRQVYAALLDEDQYLCSIRTMYRILEKNREARERRNQLRHPVYRKPELLATAANQVWSWDITKLLGPVKWSYFYLYVILDIFSRYVVGWMLAGMESSTLAKRLIQETCQKQTISPNQLTIHADRGTSMKSKPVALLLADLGITKSHSRPHTSDDNPFSEAQFKTLKYHPAFPKRFGCIQDARGFCQDFFRWYNTRHYHSGIQLLTPETVHYGKAESILNARHARRLAAYDAHPERFVSGPPVPFSLPEAVWINPPASSPITSQNLLH